MKQGSVLNLVFAAPAGQRLDTPARKAAIEKAVAQLKTREFKPADGKAGIESVGDPFDQNTFAKNGRIAYAEAQFDQTIEDADRPQVVAVEDFVRQAVAPAGVTVEFNGEAEFPPIQQGVSEALGLMAALIVLLMVFRTVVATSSPSVARTHSTRPFDAADAAGLGSGVGVWSFEHPAAPTIAATENNNAKDFHFDAAFISRNVPREKRMKTRVFNAGARR